MRFRTKVELGGKTATGFPVPEEVVAALGPGRRPAVIVTIGGHSYRSTVARMGGRFLLPLSAENRAAAGVAAGDDVDVDVEADTAPREVPVPADLDEALRLDSTAREFFDGLAYTHRKEWVRWIEEAKKPVTRGGSNVAAVHVYFHSLEPGQAEVRFSGPPDTAYADVLRAAIRELQRGVTGGCS